MGERYKAQPADQLAKFSQCCECACQNCPFVPRHEGGTEVDEAWIKFSQRHPEMTHEVYLAFLSENKTSKDEGAG